MKPKTKVRLVKQYMLKLKYEQKEVDRHCISHELWETCALDVSEEKEVFTLKCIMPMHKDRGVGDEVRMHAEVIAVFCDEIEFVRKDITPEGFKDEVN